MEGSFEKALAHTLNIEKGFVDDPTDRGGATNWGITEKVARKHGYIGRMQDMPRATAVAIYRESYWDERHLPCEQISDWYEALALELFDSGVNMDPKIAAGFLQVGLNFFNRDARTFPNLKVDGWAGTRTIEALNTLDPLRYGRNLTAFCNTLQGRRYWEICTPLDQQEAADWLRVHDGREDQEKYALGWFDKRVAQ